MMDGGKDLVLVIEMSRPRLSQFVVNSNFRVRKCRWAAVTAATARSVSRVAGGVSVVRTDCDVINILDMPRYRVSNRASDNESLNAMFLVMCVLEMQGVRIVVRSPGIRCPPLSGGLVCTRKSAACCQGWEANFTEARVQRLLTVKTLCVS